VKWGQVYRSGELPRLTEPDVKRLDELGIKTVVSFLTDTEIQFRGRDRLPTGVREISEPIDTEGELAAVIVEARKTGDFSQVPVGLNPQIHAMLPDQARQQYANLLREVAKSQNRPIVFHCSQGVHRTGAASAICCWSSSRCCPLAVPPRARQRRHSSIRTRSSNRPRSDACAGEPTVQRASSRRKDVEETTLNTHEGQPGSMGSC
jgi:hypothetical protein